MTVEAYVIAAFASYALGRIAENLLAPDPETPLVDEKESTTSTKGSFAPLLIGERRIAPVVAWVGERSMIPESVDNGGKGVGGGGNNTQDVYYEDGIHFLCIGPGEKLRRIIVNGEKQVFNNGDLITKDSHPSGSVLDVTNADGSIDRGQFEIFWGEANQPLDDWAAEDKRLGINSRWPFLMRINWRQFRLGGFAVWPTIEYEVQVRPFSLAGTQLTGAPSWGMYAPSTGNPVRDIQGVINSNIDPSGTAAFSVSEDRTSEFLVGSYALVSEQPKESVNRLYLISQSNFSAGQVHYRAGNNLSDSHNGTIERNLSNWIRDDTDMSVSTFNDEVTYGDSWPTGELESDGTIYRLTETTTSILKDLDIRTLTTTVSDGENDFSTGIQKIEVWIRGLQESFASPNTWSSWVDIGFADGGAATPIDSANLAYVKYQLDAPNGEFVLQEFNGAKGTAQGDSTGIWTKVTLLFKSDTGASDGTLQAGERRTVFIRWESAGSGINLRTDIYHAGNRLETEGPFPGDTFLYEDDGTQITGITTVVFDEWLEGGREDVGSITGLATGTGLGGANMAHCLEQLLFETFPHGAGLDRTDWDMVSLNQLAIDADAELARIHILADRGKSVKGIIALLLQDMHAYISWDPTIGKYVFGLIRDPGATPVPALPLEAILGPEPEVETLHQFNTPNMIVFGFPNRHKNYRQDTAPLDDDASAGIVNNRIIKNVKINFATDFFFAEQVAERRQTEDLIPATKYKIRANREARLLVPGRSFTTAGIDEPLRLLSTKTDPDTSKVEIEAVTDVYAIKGATVGPPSSPSFGGDDPLSPAEDLATAIWELPPFLSNNSVSIAIPRIRAGSHTGNAQVLVSTDNISYVNAKGASFIATGGTLTTDIPASSKLELTGSDAPSISALGDDILTLTNTLSTERWKTGEQLALIGDEVYYLKQLVPRGGGVYHMDGLIRARMGTSKAAHATGDTVFIFPRNSIRRVIDPLIVPETPIYFKTVPQGMSPTDITAQNPTVTGVGIKPIAVSGVRTPSGSPSYSTGEDITIRWNFHLPSSLTVRGGAGFQTAGEPMGEPMVGPQTFRVTILGGALGRTIETTTPEITYTNAQILFDNTTEYTPTFRVEMIYNGYASPFVAYTVSLV